MFVPGMGVSKTLAALVQKLGAESLLGRSGPGHAARAKRGGELKGSRDTGMALVGLSHA